MTIDLDALEALEKKATGGRWRVDDSGEVTEIRAVIEGYDVRLLSAASHIGPHSSWTGPYVVQDAKRAELEFVAAARNALPELIRLARIGQRVERVAKLDYFLSQALNEGDGVYRP